MLILTHEKKKKKTQQFQISVFSNHKVKQK